MGNINSLEKFDTNKCNSYNLVSSNVNRKEEFKTKTSKKTTKQLDALNLNFCSDDLMCQNINSEKSTVDNLVLTCPNAKCVGGTCSCGSECKKDKYTGICCLDTQQIGDETYCIENFDGNKGLNYSYV